MTTGDRQASARRRIVIQLGTTEVGKDPLGIARVFRDQVTHQRDRVRDAALVAVVEGEAHAEHDAALKALASVLWQRRRILVAAGMEQECRVERHLALVQLEWSVERTLVHVYQGDDDGGLAGPLDALPGREDGPVVQSDPPKSSRARVALGNRVRGDQAERAALPKQSNARR